MAERACDENTEPDVGSRRPPRRSSILKPARPILESVDTNVTEDLNERRRLSKRVSFSETHQIKLFKCELSGEHGSSCENALEAGSATTAGNKTLPSNAAEDLMGEAVQLLQYDHTPLEQSFYHEADNSDAEAASPTKRASVLMEEAQSCLVFTQHGDVSVACDGAGNQFCLETMLACRTMDITCVGAPAVDQTISKLSKTMLADKSIEMTFARACAHNQTAAGPQDATKFDGDATVHLQDTVNITCAVGSTSFVTGAANDVDTGVKCDVRGTVHSAVIPAPAVSCAGSISSTAVPFDLADFVASTRRNHFSDIMGEDALCVAEASCVPAPSGATCSYMGMENVVREMGNRGLSPVETAAPDYSAVTMNVTGLDVSAGPRFTSFAQLSNADLSAASCTEPNASTPVTLASSKCGTDTQMLHNSQAMMVTCGVGDAFFPDSPLGVVRRSLCLDTNPVRPTNPGTCADRSEDLAPHAEAQSRTTCGKKDVDAGKNSLLASAMDMTCTSSAVPTRSGGSTTSAQVVSQHFKTLTSVVPDVMNMTCTDRAVLANVGCSGTRLSCANPASTTLHYDDANLTGAMNITCPNTTRCPLLVAEMTDLNVEPNGRLNEEHAPHAVSGSTRRDIDEHSLHQASSHCPLEVLNVMAPDGVGADGDGNLDCAAEDPQVSVASSNVAVGNKSGMDSCHSLASLRVSGRCEVGVAASVAECSDALPQDFPVPSEITGPSVLKATPADGPTDKLCRVECATSSTMLVRPTPSKGSTNVSAKGSESKCLNARALPVVVLTGKDSIAHQHLASPAAKGSLKGVVGPTRMGSAVLSSMSKSRKAASKMDLTAATEMFNSLTDSAVDVSNVTALLDMPSGYVSSLSLLSDVFSPERVAKEKARHGGASGSKSLTKAQQQPGSAGRSHRARDRGQHLTDNGEVGANSEKMAAPYGDPPQDQAAASLLSSKKSLLVTATSTGISEVNLGSVPRHLDTALKEDTAGISTTMVDRCPQPNATTFSPATGLNATSVPGTQHVCAGLSACQHNIEPTRKSATFLVSSANNARPSATFAVLSPPCRVICIDNGTTVDECNSDVPQDPRLSATHRLLVKEPAVTVDQSDNSCRDQSTTVSKSRKKLEFTEIGPRPPQSSTEGDCVGRVADSCREDARRNVPIVSPSSRLRSDMSHCQTRPDVDASCHQLHGTSSASLTNVLQHSTGGRSNDVEMLLDVPEPSLVTNSPTTSSVDSLRSSKSNEVADQPVCHAEVGEHPSGAAEAPGTGVCIPANMFYSSSAKKRSKPLTPSSKSSDKCRSTAKKRRPTQAGVKGGGSKRHLCSPASTGKKRQKLLQEERSAAKSVRKATAGDASSRKPVQQRTESTARTEMDILRSVFSYRPKLRSLPPSPVASSSPKQSPSPLAPLKWPEGLALPEDLMLSGDFSLATLSPVQARLSRKSDNVNGTPAEGASAGSAVEKDEDSDSSLFEIPDPQLDLTANVDILGIIDRLDDTNVNESLYWSFHEIPADSLKKWQLHVWRLEADRAVFTYIKGSLKLVMKLGDYVKLPDTEDKLALARAAHGGEVRRRVKHIKSLRYEVTCRPKAQFNKYMLNRRLQEMHKTDELLKQYPTTDCLEKLLGDVGSFFARYWPLTRDIYVISKCHHHAFEYPVLSVQIIASRRLIWFHLDLPIDIDAYPNAVIVPSMRPYSDEYDVIPTEKLRRITAHVDPGPKYLVRLVDEIENFLGK